MKLRIIITLSTLALLISIASTLNAQTTLRCETASSSAVIYGTSNIHDWEMTATEFTSQAKVEIKAGTSVTILEGSMLFKAMKIKSESSGMDKKAQESLKAESNPDITFTITAPVTLTLNGNKASGNITGTLLLAGIRKTIIVPVTLEIDASAKMVVTSNIKIKMTDYQMEPPTAVFGTIKCGDSVEVKLKMVYSAK